MGKWRKLIWTGLTGSALALAPMQAAPAAALDENNPRIIGAGPRPVPPTEGPGAIDFEIDCAASAEKIEEDFARIMANPDSWFARAGAMGEHSQRLTIWYQQQFIRAGVWTQTEAQTFAANSLEQPEMAEAMVWAVGFAEGMMTDLTRAMELEQAGDKIGACNAVQGIFGRLREAPAIMRRQWSGIDRIYTAEAARLGVTIPQ